ncbi:hypothetical protein HZB04_01905 [Candidatus Wolfebacteria bacterium]|nr:hypothetical protein [Candidatus Wolfebacteria bacterium]
MNKIINIKFKKIISLFSIFCIAILLSTFYFLLSINSAQAALGGLVPCGPGISGNETCNFCHLITLVNRIINFALYDIAIPLVVVMTLYGGFVIMTAGDDAGKVTEGKNIIQAAVIGVLVALGAWLIINTVLLALTDNQSLILTPWKWGGKDLFKCS